MVGITYPSQPGKQTMFAYDGLSRRTAISSSPAGGGNALTASYVWCGPRICQARNASGSITREYFAEGEFVPGAPAQSYYYGLDQIGSVRRVFASTSNAPSYSYDPYGNALQATAPLTDFGYAGMFYNADSGLYLTLYRAYDPVVARWIFRDPIGVMRHQDDSTIPYHLSDWLGTTVALIGTSGRNEGHPFKLIGGTTSLVTRVNLYAYVNEPIYQTDKNGLFPGESGGASSGGCGPNEVPFGQAPDGTSVDPAGWKTCLMVICIISGMHKLACTRFG